MTKLSEEPLRWLVAFDNAHSKDEEVHEDALGSILRKVSDEDNPSSIAVKAPEPSKTKPSHKKKSLRNKSGAANPKNLGLMDTRASSGSEDSGSADSSSKKRKKSNGTDMIADDRQSSYADTDTYKFKVSDREERSRRRQQIVEEDKPGASQTVFKPSNGKHNGTGQPSSKKAKTKGNEEVVKIPMRTGTLYLYRGIRRRVAFVRKL